MNYFFTKLKDRNTLLYYFGLLCLIGALVCVGLFFFTNLQVLGVNAFIKPLKFFVSIWIFAWTMGWIMYLLDKKRKVIIYSWVVVVAMVIELVIITWQAANGRLSHFNISTFFYARLFDVMGVAITIMTIWTGYIGYLFFRQKRFKASDAYIWGIRLGLIFFVVFAFEGGIMAARLAHTVGAADGGPGLPLINWSRQYGDLRIAHFMGMHALQLLPLYGFYMARQPRQVIIFAGVYLAIVTTLLLLAIQGMPIF